MDECLFREADIFSLSPDILCVATAEGVFLRVNPAFERILGYREEQILHTSFFDLLHPDHVEETRQELRHIPSHGPAAYFESRQRCQDGAYKWIAWTVAPSADGRLLFVVGRDATVRKRTQEALRENERRLSTLMANLPGIAYRCANDGLWTMEFISQGCHELTGYTASELVGGEGVSYNDLINPQDRIQVKGLVKTALNAQRPFRVEYRISTAPGEEKWVLEQGMGIFDADGNLDAIEGLVIDITDRKRAEDALRESEHRLQVKFDYLSSPEEDLGDFSLTDLVDLRDLQKIQDAFAEALGVSASITHVDGRLITKPSNLSRVCSLVRATKKGSERCSISARVLGEKARRQMRPGYQECLSLGFVDAGAPIIVAGRHVANWVAGQCNIMGVDRKRIRAYALEIGADVDEMLRAFDEMPPQMSLKKFEQVMNLQWMIAKEISRLGYNNLKLAKKIAELTGTQQALAKSEERFRRLVEHALLGIFIIREGKVAYMNPEQERISADLPRWLVSGDLSRIHPEDRGRAAILMESLGSGAVRSMDAELRFTRSVPEGAVPEMRWISCRGSVVEYRGTDAVMFNTTDVTRAKELARMVQIQDKMTSLGRVAAGLAHEIRNPLSGINIGLNALRKIHERGQGTERMEEILAHLHNASNKIEGVIRRVMDFSKPGAPHLVPIDINSPVREAVELSAVMLRKSGIGLDLKLREDLPRCAADFQLMEQVLLNFITNAAEAMADWNGTRRILVSTGADESHVTVVIADSGPGIDPAVKEKIFDPFFTTKSGNSGIGLSLSHRIITDHGGHVQAGTGPWGGARFVISLPLTQEARTG